jgi:hypothetical protein
LETFLDLAKRIVKSLNTAELDYAFTGALAASFYGVPRTTTDIDFMVKFSTDDLKSRLVPALRNAGLVVDEREINRALESGYRIARLRDNKTPYSVDIIFSNKKLEKRAGTIANLPTFFQASEDLILAKLRMIKATMPRERARKDEEDIRAILRFTKVNMEAVTKQARKTGTLSILRTITEDAEN